MVEDEALADALASARCFVPAETPAATLVRDLAIRGGRALRDDEEQRAARLRELAEWSTRPDPPWDRDVLARIDELTVE